VKLPIQVPDALRSFFSGLSGTIRFKVSRFLLSQRPATICIERAGDACTQVHIKIILMIQGQIYRRDYIRFIYGQGDSTAIEVTFANHGSPRMSRVLG